MLNARDDAGRCVRQSTIEIEEKKRQDVGSSLNVQDMAYTLPVRRLPHVESAPRAAGRMTGGIGGSQQGAALIIRTYTLLRSPPVRKWGTRVRRWDIR